MLLAYIDSFAGLSGVTILEALISVGLSREQIERALDGLPDGQSQLALDAFRKSVAASNMPLVVKKTVGALINKLYEAETALHAKEQQEAMPRTGPQHWRMDELRASAGVVLGLIHLGIGRVECSPLPIGGWSSERHGKSEGSPGLTFSPLTAEILCGASVPVYGSDRNNESITPVGAALVATLASGFGPLPAMTIRGIGYGKDQALQTRLFIGERSPITASIDIPQKEQSRPAKTDATAQAQELVAVAVTPAPVEEPNTAAKNPQVQNHYIAAVEEWVALSIKGHQQSGRQRA